MEATARAYSALSVKLKKVEGERHVLHGARLDRKLGMVNGVTRIGERQLSFYLWQVSQVLLSKYHGHSAPGFIKKIRNRSSNKLGLARYWLLKRSPSSEAPLLFVKQAARSTPRERAF